jgi:transketolase
MRNAFVAALTKLAEEDERIVVLSGDIGYGVFDDFRERWPHRFINMGIAEQNMVGVAAGMAIEGKRPVIYTIVPFATMRCFEQLRVDVCMHNLPVKVVGIGGGLAYGALGPTHHAIEDIAVMRALPNIRVLVPHDPCSTIVATREMIASSGPVYLRLGKNGEPNLVPHDIYRRTEMSIITCGPIAAVAIEAAQRIEEISANSTCNVIYCVRVKPFSPAVREIIRKRCIIVTLEEHSIIGGLGSAVAEEIAESNDFKPFFRRIGIKDKFVTDVGDQRYLWEKCGLTAQRVVDTVMELVNT